MQERKEGVGVSLYSEHYRGSAYFLERQYEAIKILVGHKSIFGPLIPLVWTSDEVSSGFQSQSGQFFFYILVGHMSMSGLLMPLFWTSDDLSSGAQIKLNLTVSQSVN